MIKNKILLIAFLLGSFFTQMSSRDDLYNYIDETLDRANNKNVISFVVHEKKDNIDIKKIREQQVVLDDFPEAPEVKKLIIEEKPVLVDELKVEKIKNAFQFEPYVDCGYEIFSKQKKQIETMVNFAYNYVKKNSIADACNTFASSDEWTFENSGIFLLDGNGVCHVEAGWDIFTWCMSEQTSFNQIKKASEKGDWIMHPWHNGLQFSYVRKIVRQGKEFFIGAGMYPDDTCLRSEKLAQDIISYLEDYKITKLVSAINDQSAPFFYNQGDFGLIILDESGNVVVDVNNPKLSGVSSLNWVDDNGNTIYSALIDQVKNEESLRFTLSDRGFKKVVYVKHVSAPLDESGNKSYFIIISHFVKLIESDISSFVIHAAQYVQEYDRGRTIQEFSNPQGPFSVDSLKIMLFDMDGNIVVGPSNKSFLGKDILQSLKDKEEGWLSYVNSSGYSVVFYKKIKSSHGSYIICSEMLPVGLFQRAESIVSKMISRIKNEPLSLLCQSLADSPRQSVINPLHVSMYTESGDCLFSTESIPAWRKYSNRKQWRKISEIASAGGGVFTYMTKRGKKYITIRMIDANNIKFSQEFDEPEEAETTKDLVIRQKNPSVVAKRNNENYIKGIVVLVSHY